MKDARGLDVMGVADEALGAINDFVARLLRLDAGVERVIEAAERFPDVSILQLYAAAAHLYAQTRAANHTAGKFLSAAAAAPGNERERMLLAALEKWHAGQYLRAVEILEEITARWPADLCSAKFCEFLYYVLGQQHMGARFRGQIERIAAVNANDPDFLGMAAFAHELCGDFDEAERASERALRIEPRNPWAHHALSHVLLRQGRIDEGRERLENFLPALRTCGRAVHCHDAWHLALLHLEALDFESALRVFREDIWGWTPDAVGEQIDAIALLWRAEMAGEPMDGEWGAIADRVALHAGETFMPFLSAHFACALARAGRGGALDELLDGVAARSEEDDDEAKRVWAPAGRAVVEASAAFGLGDHAAAAEILDPVMPAMTMIGGSDAQDDLFRQMYLVSLHAAGRRADADAYFDQITSGRRLTALDRVLGEHPTHSYERSHEVA